MENAIILIFGASGDLAQRKLIPAFYHLFASGSLPKDFAIVGTGRSDLSEESFRQHLIMALDEGESSRMNDFASHLYYQKTFPDTQQDFKQLKKRLAELSAKHQTGNNILYYLATPPQLYGIITEKLAGTGMNQDAGGWKRLVVEKPFGYDLQSAFALDKTLHSCFSEQQIYRIDHYLGKETVQNMLVLRFSNAMFEPLWNRNFIDHVEITSAEFLGVEERGGYYDNAGAVRDMLQNHLLQVLALVAMEPPAKIDAHSMRDEAVKVMQCFRPLAQENLQHDLVLGQYTGATFRGNHLPAYREERGVAPDSRTETYAALKMFIENWRWQGVPFYLRTGKRLPTKVTEVVLYLRKTPHPAFVQTAPENKIIIRIQPDEGILITFALKEPGTGFKATEVGMDFHYKDLSKTMILSAYERLLLDAVKGDATLFARTDAVQACWEFVQPILAYKESSQASLYGYAAGTWGPHKADKLLAEDGRTWRFPCKNLTMTDYCEL
ncbi:MAG: glucose-6-phosphate dehydrogenase [Deltaproteobacteria bacterium]|nr:MAG: glucose-6-phosphate dehydrogenase [Deltaproteobacteria bacterium]